MPNLPSPVIPDTPSAAINSHLRERFGKKPENLLQALLAHFVCHIFFAINYIYQLLNKNAARNKSKWMVACGIMGVAVLIGAWLVYTLLIGASFLVHYIVYYAFVILAMSGVGLAVVGVLLFDKQAKETKGGSNIGKEFTAATNRVVQDTKDVLYPDYKKD